MASDAAVDSSGSIVCPSCGCADFRCYKTDGNFRYKSCRNCGHKVLTATKSSERIVRDIDARQPLESDGLGGIDDDDSELSSSVVKFAG